MSDLPNAQGANLPITCMTLYKHGVGYFERRAELSGEKIGLSFRVAEMNDVLKSLTAIDWGGGQVLGIDDAEHIDNRIARFCDQFPQDKKHRWVRDLAAELLHGLSPERYPLMTRWVWDRTANTGVIREIWFDDDIDSLTLNVPDGYDTYLVLRQELSQFLTDNGVFRDVVWYVDLLCAKVYADYISAQGGLYLRADFSSPEDPMQHTRRLLGLDGVKPRSGRTRLKSISGEAFVIEDGQLLEND